MTLQTNVADSNLLFAELATTPPLPPANSFKVYVKDVGGVTHLVGLDSDGTITDYHVRQILSATTNIYVAASGSDSTGTGTSGSPFKTLQHAYDYVVGTYDFAGQTVNINLHAGDTFAPLSITKAWVGGGALNIVGDVYPTPTTILANSGSLDNISCNVPLPGQITLSKVKITNTGGFSGINLTAAGLIAATNIEWSTFTGGVHLNANGSGAKVEEFGANKTTANGNSHAAAQFGAYVLLATGSLTLTGSPTFANAFFNAHDLGLIQVATDFTFSGAATSTAKYFLNNNSVLRTDGNNASIPGSFPGPGGAVNGSQAGT